VQDCNAAVELLQAAHLQLQLAAGQPEAEQELLAGLLPAATAAASAGAGSNANAAEQQPTEPGGIEASSPIAGLDKQLQQQQLPQQAGQQQQAAAPAPSVDKPDPGAGAGSSSGAVYKLQRQLAKVLGRRAAAHVELQQLQQGWEDLQEALRCAAIREALAYM
jgi:hypothetical protein